MNLSRRSFIAKTATASLIGPSLLPHLLQAKDAAPGIRVGICDWSYGGKSPAALEAAKKIGLDGVEISPTSADDTLSYSKPEIQEQYRKAMKETGLVVASLAMTIGNGNPIATDPRAPAWLEQTIKATNALGAESILMAFFGKGSLQDKNGPDGLKEKEFKMLVERLKAVAPLAKEKGAYLGLENTLSAKQNIKIMDAVGSDHIKVYYDIANSTRNGYNVPEEIEMLGDRICQFHFKDNKGEFNSGNPEMGPIIKAVKKINYKGWLILERGFGKDKAAYFKKNGEFIRDAFGL